MSETPSPEQAQKIQHTPVGELIAEAKIAQNSMGPPTPDSRDSTWADPYGDQVQRQEPPDALKTLLQRIGEFAGEKVQDQGQPEPNISESSLSIDDIRFSSFAEPPKEAAFDIPEGENLRFPPNIKQYLQEQASALEEAQNDPKREDVKYLRKYTEKFREYYGRLTWKYQDNSEELNALMILLTKAGFARHEPSFSSGRYQPDLIYHTMKILRSPIRFSGDQMTIDTRSEASWSRIQNQNIHPEVFAREIFNKAVSITGKDKSDKPNIEPYDFDCCVISALSCGEVSVAFELIKMAPQFFPDMGNQAIDNAFSRLQGTFLEARTLSPVLAESIDAGLASLGEEGRLKEIGDGSIAQRLKKAAEGRLRRDILEQKKAWYESKKVVDVEKRMAQISQEGIKELLYKMADEARTWDDVEGEIKKRCADIVDGKAANLLAGELIRRMYPDVSVEEQLRMKKNLFLGKEPGTYGYLDPANRIDYSLEVADGAYFSEQTRAQKQQTVNRTTFPTESELRETIYKPRDGKYIQILIAMLRYPDNLDFNIQTAFQNAKKREGSYGYNYKADPDTRMKEGRRVLATRLVGGLTFLQSCAEDPDIKSLMEKEFGLGTGQGSLLRSENLEKARKHLEGMFHDVIDENGLTLFESVLPEPDQQAEDMRVFHQITEARKKETGTLERKKTAESRTILTDTILQHKEEQTRLESERQTRRVLLEKQREARQAIEQIQTELEAAKQLKTGNGLDILMRKAVSKTEKATLIASLQSKLESQQQAVEIAESELRKHPEINDKEYEEHTRMTRLLEQLASDGKAIK